MTLDSLLVVVLLMIGCVLLPYVIHIVQDWINDEPKE